MIEPSTGIIAPGNAAKGGTRPVARYVKHSGTILALRFGTVAAFLGAWETVSRLGLVNPLFASSPSLIFAKLVEMLRDGSLWPHIAATAEIAAAGFALSVVVGVPLGLIIGRSPLIRAAVEPFTTALYASPQVAFLPLLIIWLGIGITSKVALVFLGSFVIMVVNTETGVEQADRRLIETARSFMANEWQILLKIVLPAALPYIIAGMRLATGRALVMVVVAEIYASNKGLGYLIFQAGGMYDTAQVFVGVLILATTGVVLNALLRALERRLAPWRIDEA